MISKLIDEILRPASDYIYGFANLEGLVHDKFKAYPFGISIGKRLDDQIIAKLENGPTFEYFEHYRKVNSELRILTCRIGTALNKLEIDTILIEPTIILGAKGNERYLETLTVELSHKMVATRAGLGWIGKSDLFVSDIFGPRLRLVSILINKDPEKYLKPVIESRCGKCTICVDKCPAHAATGQLWNIKIHRDEYFDAFKCRKKCGELARQNLNVDEYICGLCVSVCPKGKSKQIKIKN